MLFFRRSFFTFGKRFSIIFYKNSGIIAAVFRKEPIIIFTFYSIVSIFAKSKIMYLSDLNAGEQRRALKGNLFQKSIEKYWRAKKRRWWLEDVRGYCP